MRAKRNFFERLRLVIILTFAIIVLACEARDAPAVSISDLKVYAPISGASVSGAYCTIENSTKESRTLIRVSSPQFRRVEMHEMVKTANMMGMRKLDTVAIESGDRVSFVEGGRHLMLIDPLTDMNAGDTVDLRFEFDDGQLLSISTVLLSRLD